MKKLICALVLLAMLVPVAAMAAGPMNDTAPGTSLTYDEYSKCELRVNGMNDVRRQYQWRDEEKKVTYTARFFLTNALEKVIAVYDECQCVVAFRPDGVVAAGDSKIKPNCDLKHETPLALVELEPDEGDNVPYESILEVARQYGWKGTLEEFLTAITTADATNSADGDHIVAADQAGFSISFKGQAKQFVHFGPIIYHARNQMLRVYGDNSKNTLMWSGYNLGDGLLKEYGLFSEDGFVLTVYDSKNRLDSTEIWTEDGAYWCCFGGEWEYSAAGDPDNTVTDKVPDGEVLKKIGVSTRVAKFEVDNSEGTPIVRGNVAAETEVKMLDSHTTEFEMSTTNRGKLAEPITLLLPYGPGQNREIAEQFTYTVVHKPDGGADENYSTDPISASEIKMEFTENGVELSGVTSFSPFTVTWGDKQASTVGTEGVGSLPSTGDGSNLLAYVCLLTACAAAFVVINKRRAHQ